MSEGQKFLRDAATLLPIIGRHPVLGYDLVWADRTVRSEKRTSIVRAVVRNISVGSQ